MSSSSGQPASSSSSSSRQTVYKKIGQYSLIKEIGVGSFARVYKGRSDTNSAVNGGIPEEFAIKMVSKVHLREEN